MGRWQGLQVEDLYEGGFLLLKQGRMLVHIIVLFDNETRYEPDGSADDGIIGL